METLSVILVILCSAIMAAAMYWFADVRAKATLIALLQEQLKAQKEEMREWQNKALTRSGGGSLDQKPTPIPVKTQEITPKVVTRQQLEYREQEPMQTPVTIHAHDINYQRVGKTVEQVAEIINAHK